MSSLDLLAALAGNTDNVIVYRIFGVKKQPAYYSGIKRSFADRKEPECCVQER